MKKYLAFCLFPLPLTLLMFAVGFILTFLPSVSIRRKRIGKILMGLSTAMILLFACFGWIPVRWLETRYKPLDVTDPFAADGPCVICVFGTSYLYDDEIPSPTRMGASMALRLLEGCRIAHELESRHAVYRLVVSMQVGKRHEDACPWETRLKDVLSFTDLFGIPHDRVEILNDFCRNSKDEMTDFAAFPGRHILVSSAAHVPRLMILASRCGIEQPVAAPAGLQFSPNHLQNCFPSSQNLEFLRQAAYELYGTLQYSIGF